MKITSMFSKVNWHQAGQSVIDGAANTMGTVFVYAIILFIFFAWFRKQKKGAEEKKDGGGDGGSQSFLAKALSFSKPATSFNNATSFFGTSNDSLDSGKAWV